MRITDPNDLRYRVPSPLPRRVTPSSLSEIDNLIAERQPREPRRVEDYAGEGYPLPTVDVNGRLHAPCDGWTDFTGRQYCGGQYVMEEEGEAHTAWFAMMLKLSDGTTVSRTVSKSFSGEVRKIAYASEQSLRKSSSYQFLELGRHDFINLQCVEIFRNSGPYGATLAHTFVDDSGNIYTWKTSREVCMPGKFVSLKATVKSHYTNKFGVKITTLTRAKEIL